LLYHQHQLCQLRAGRGGEMAHNMQNGIMSRSYFVHEREATMMQEQTRQLHRSSTNRMLAGVCGGLGDYFDIDPTIIRIITLALVLPFHIFVVLAYLALAVFIPADMRQ
jgi:phage shock protein C